MKIWYGYCSEHSMNLVMIGRFKNATDAESAKWVIESLTQKVNADVQSGQMKVGELRDSYGDSMLDFLQKVKLYCIGPAELEQFAYDVTVKVKGNEVVLRTDESDVSAFLKVLLDKGARVEVFSAHDYPETEDDAEK